MGGLYSLDSLEVFDPTTAIIVDSTGPVLSLPADITELTPGGEWPRPW